MEKNQFKNSLGVGFLLIILRFSVSAMPQLPGRKRIVCDTILFLKKHEVLYHPLSLTRHIIPKEAHSGPSFEYYS